MPSSANPPKAAVHPVITSHVRFALVLGRLEEMDGNTASSSAERQSSCIAGLVHQLGLERLFDTWSPAITGKREPEVISLDANAWSRWFKGKNNSPVSSIYECRVFYGLEAPNNLARRFQEFLRKGITETKREDRSKRQYNRIHSWGDYAAELVRRNGGWEQFTTLPHLCDPPVDNSVDPILLDATMAKRILSLKAHRYVQILAASVGVMWPIWLLKEELFNWFVHILHEAGYPKEKIRRLEKRNDVYIDINPYVGAMRGLPYPFGCADEFLATHPESVLDEHGNGPDVYKHYPWQQTLVARIQHSLMDEKWSPPLLFGGRGDQWGSLKSTKTEETDEPVPLISIAETCPVFARTYVRRQFAESRPGKHRSKQPPPPRLYYEEHTWASEAIERMSYDIREKARGIEWVDMVTDGTDAPDADGFLSYFPADVLLQANEDFVRVPIYDVCRAGFDIKDARHLCYMLPRTVLVGGRWLSGQPKMVKLLEDLGKALLHVEQTFVDLAPEWRASSKVVGDGLESIGDGNAEGRQRVIDDLARLCKYRAAILRIDPHQHDLLIQVLARIGREMMRNPLTAEDSRESRIGKAFQEWGWAQLLDFIKYTNIGFTSELQIGA